MDNNLSKKNDGTQTPSLKKQQNFEACDVVNVACTTVVTDIRLHFFLFSQRSAYSWAACCWSFIRARKHAAIGANDGKAN